MVALALLFMAACSDPAPELETTSTDEPAPTAAAASSTEAEPVDAEPENAEPDDVDPDDAEPSAAAAVDDGSVVFQFAGEYWLLGEVPSQAVPADPTADAIRVGMINQENTPLGSFPEMRGAAEAAVAWVNAELGGVDGRPIQLVTCITSFSVEQSQSCAQEMVQEDVVALVGGIDVTSNGSLPVLEQNGLPTIGGIPANLVEQQSEANFYFSGGSAGGMAAMLAHAANEGAETAMIAYGEFESFEVAARDYAGAVGESLGMQVEYRPFPIIGADMLPVLTAAVTADVDALVVAAADSACVPIMEGAAQLELRARVYLVGACAADPILEAAGESAAGVIFSSEGPADPDHIEGLMYLAVIDQYATDPAGGAGTVGFRGMMNLYSLLVELGGDNISSESVLDLVRGAVDRPSFWGHSYTCDGQRVPGLPALCAPEQTLFTTTGVPGEDFVFLAEGFESTGGWVETDDLFADALG